MDQALATAPMRWWVLRSTNTGCNHAGSLRGFQDHSIKLRQLTNGPCYTLHSVTAALPARSRNPDITQVRTHANDS